MVRGSGDGAVLLTEAALCCTCGSSCDFSATGGAFVRAVAEFPLLACFSGEDQCHQRKRQTMHKMALIAIVLLLIALGNVGYCNRSKLGNSTARLFDTVSQKIHNARDRRFRVQIVHAD